MTTHNLHQVEGSWHRIHVLRTAPRKSSSTLIAAALIFGPVALIFGIGALAL